MGYGGKSVDGSCGEEMMGNLFLNQLADNGGNHQQASIAEGSKHEAFNRHIESEVAGPVTAIGNARWWQVHSFALLLRLIPSSLTTKNRCPTPPAQFLPLTILATTIGNSATS